MSILTWLKQASISASKTELIDTDSMTFAPGEEEFYGLDMKEALDVHMQWVRSLEGWVSGEDLEPLDAATATSDCECALGKWLHGTAKQQFGGSADYQELCRVHADFHLKAGEILSSMVNADQDKVTDNLKAIRSQSGKVQLALVRLYSHAKQ